MKRRQTVTLSTELVQSLLGLGDVEILDARVDHFRGGLLQLVVASGDAPEVVEGGEPPEVRLEDVTDTPLGGLPNPWVSPPDLPDEPATAGS